MENRINNQQSTINKAKAKQKRMATEIGKEFAKSIKEGVDSIRIRGILTMEDMKLLASLLQHNHTLTHLDLGDWRGTATIGEEGAILLASALHTNTSITSVHIGCNRIGKEGARCLASALRHNNTIVTVGIYNNWVNADEANHLASTLRENKSITTMHLEYNYIAEEGAKAIAEALKKNPTLTDLRWHYRLGELLKSDLSEDLWGKKDSEILSHFKTKKAVKLLLVLAVSADNLSYRFTLQ